ncbi:unconventional SNARE in the ER 1 homolog [Nesidiocoris tenuis]|nr:unconventional SNARE in the ER 1 homolog [Nesidiocoris tenuis]
MSELNDSQAKWTVKSMREELDLSRTRGGRDRRARNYSPERLLKYHDDQQAHITESMLQMASTLKSQSVDANQIIKRDVRRLESAKVAAEDNTGALTSASSRLATCSKDNTNWCLIILVIVVFMIFINMVIFIKFMKKS